MTYCKPYPLPTRRDWVRQFVLCCLIGLGVGQAEVKAATVQPLEPVYLYSSPLTAAFFSSNGSNYDALKTRWREYLRSFYGNANREVSRDSLLAGLKPGVLILGSAILLDDKERKAIQTFADAGGSILVTWGTGARNGKGQWAGYGFIEDLLKMKVLGPVTPKDDLGFINTFGDHPVTWGLPGGQRIFFGKYRRNALARSVLQSGGSLFRLAAIPRANGREWRNRVS
jgi:hypothetical protein